MKIYTEKQKFNQIWLWLLLLFSGFIPVVILGSGLYVQLVKGEQFGNNPMSDNGLIFTFILTLILAIGLVLLFATSKLTTRINKTGIYVKFFPFHWREHHYRWQEIERYEVVKYQPIREFGGWGVRYARKSKAYNVSGNQGLRLFFKKGNQLLIGTQESKNLTIFLERLNPLEKGLLPSQQ
ncbi:MAG: hypothetical protein FD155_1241 [Bacteroidetes bacterium]|nr:MAG: hypothetical protein FD155_1241 [Bacteroidota bacterium]